MEEFKTLSSEAHKNFIDLISYIYGNNPERKAYFPADSTSLQRLITSLNDVDCQKELSGKGSVEEQMACLFGEDWRNAGISLEYPDEIKDEKTAEHSIEYEHTNCSTYEQDKALLLSSIDYILANENLIPGDIIKDDIVSFRENVLHMVPAALVKLVKGLAKHTLTGNRTLQHEDVINCIRESKEKPIQCTFKDLVNLVRKDNPYIWEKEERLGNEATERLNTLKEEIADDNFLSINGTITQLKYTVHDTQSDAAILRKALEFIEEHKSSYANAISPYLWDEVKAVIVNMACRNAGMSSCLNKNYVDAFLSEPTTVKKGRRIYCDEVIAHAKRTLDEERDKAREERFERANRMTDAEFSAALVEKKEREGLYRSMFGNVPPLKRVGDSYEYDLSALDNVIGSAKYSRPRKPIADYLAPSTTIDTIKPTVEVNTTAAPRTSEGLVDIEKMIHGIKDKTSGYEMVEHPNHYNQYPKETIDMMVDIYGKENTALWCEMTAFKYRMRMGTKPENSLEQDLKKEKWYLDKAAELKRK